MSLWDSVPESLRSGGALDTLRPALESVDAPAPTERAESDGTWRIWSTTLGGAQPVSLDPATGGFRVGPAGGGGGAASTPLEFPDPRVGLELGLRLAAPGGAPDGTVRVVVDTPSAVLRLPFLRGAQLDAQGQLRADPANPSVRFLLPALRVRLLRPAGGALDVSLAAATAPGGTPVDKIYDFVRMEPPYALIGPGDVVGFAFRAAVLDLSGVAAVGSVPGVPASARTMPAEWQGLYLPEARLFVAPSGMEGLAVSAGVRDLWIGIGRHAGVTGLFEAEVVNRGSAPTVRLRFQTPTGEWIGVPDADPPPTVNLPERARLYADAGGGLAPFAWQITAGATVAAADRLDVEVPAVGTLAITVRATDAAAHVTTRSISVQRRAAPAGGAPAGPGAQAVAVQQAPGATSRVVVVASTDTTATVRLEPAGGTVAWSWPGGSASGATATVPVAAGATVSVTATRTYAAAAPVTIDAYTLFDRPRAQDNVATWAAVRDNLHTAPASSRTGWGGAPPLGDDAFRARLAALPAGTTWTVEGWASYEDDDSEGKQRYNRELSARRRDALVELLALSSVPRARITPGAAHGHAPARLGTSPDAPAPAPSATSSAWWRARAVGTPPAASAETIPAQLVRPAATPAVTPVDRDPAPSRAPVPDCFRRIGVRVELVRGTFVRAEVYGEFDVQTAAEQRVAASGGGRTLPARTNPQDGVCAFLVRLRIAEDRASWDVTAEFRAVEGDLDGLARFARPSGSNTGGIDVLGAVSTLAPLLAAATPPSPTAGELVPMVLLTSAAVGIGASGVMRTHEVILRGGQLMVADAPAPAPAPAGVRTTQVSVLLDVETAFTFDLGFIRVRPESPVRARYQAVGLRSTWQSVPRGDGTVEYVPLPVFDPSRGYALDIPAGALVANEPLGEILRILGVRVSRDNPTYLEVEAGLGVDLGIVTVDTVRVRLRLDQPELPQLTKLGASLDIPGTLHGRGSLEFLPAGGIAGTFDLTVTPLNVRAAAQFAMSKTGDVTSVLVGAEVEFPVPIPLGNSGLGLFGFLGGVGVNYARLEPTGVPAPALRWLEQQLAPARNSVMHPAGWTPRAGAYAFAAGVLLGTAEGGFVVHTKGIVLIELPGPRLLLVMKADVLKLPPVLKSQSNATFLAVLDLDFARGTITIGVVAEYTVQSLLRVRVPVTAFFNTNQPQEWFVDLGTYTEPVTVEVLDVFSGTGYLMIHGAGIVPPPPPLAALVGGGTGLTIAVGFHIQAVLMGSKAVGLYLEVAAGFDALVSLDPFVIAGRIYARGELRLWIVGISASAELVVAVGRQRVTGPDGAVTEVERTYVHGEACGEVDFFFFSVRGCVSLTLGDSPPPAPVAPPLVAGVKLVSRSPALVEGTAVDRAVDGALGDAAAVGSAAPLPSVPLDAIPVVLFEVPPGVAGPNLVLGGDARGASGLPADPWVRRGNRWWRYQITGVELVGALQPAPPAGKTPATWWARAADADPQQQSPALALLSWLPTPTPRAVPYGERLTKTIEERWGRVCEPAAPPAPVLWTFDGQPVGPSRPGWRLRGVPWPDPPGTFRSSPADGRLTVTERWRTGDARADQVQGTDPAVVVGDAVPCTSRTEHPGANLKEWGANQPLTFSRAALPVDESAFAAAAELLAAGTSLADATAHWSESGWDAGLAARPLACQGRVLRSPYADEAEPAPAGTPDEVELVARARDKAGFEPSPLEDAVVLRQAGGLRALRALLLVPGRLVQKQLVLAFRAADGRPLGERRVTPDDVLSGTRTLPPSWLDPAGPWFDPVQRAGRIAARAAALSSAPGAGPPTNLVAVLVDLDLPGETAEVEVGWDRALVQQGTPGAFWVVALEGLVVSESRRSEWDTTTQTQDRDVLTSALTQDPDDHALFVPGTTYTVRVRWQGASVEQEAKPDAAAAPAWGAEQVQEFRFVADPATKAPADLAPWLLATSPAMGEVGSLCKEPVRIALATQKVAALFDAYGEELRVQVRAASGRHPAPPGGAAGDPLTIPVAVDGVRVKAMGGAAGGLRIPTPWQQAVEERTGNLPCKPGAGSRTHHSVVEIPYDLEPLTDYLLDVYAVPKGAPAAAAGRRVHRVNFTTSRFARVEDLARLVSLSAVEHRLVPTPSALAALAAEPTGDQLDTAFQQAGLSAPQVPRYPRVQVLWSPDAVPQPVAVVVEGSEALWRQRPIPEQVSGPADAGDPSHKWWAARRKDWLSLAPSSAAPAAGEPPLAGVTRVVRAPGWTRAVVLLAAGARGSEVRLDLMLAADPLAATPERRAEAVRLRLVRAPWEDLD